MPSCPNPPDPTPAGPDSPPPDHTPDGTGPDATGRDVPPPLRDVAAGDGGPPEGGRERSALEAAEDAFGWLTGGPSPLRLPPVAGLPHGLGLRAARMRMQTGSMPAATSAAVWAVVIEHAQTEARDRGPGSRWTVAVVGLALPELARIVATAAPAYAGHPADLEAAALVGLVAAVHRTPATPDALSPHALHEVPSPGARLWSGPPSGASRWSPGLWHTLPRVLYLAATAACQRLVDALAVAGYVTNPLPPPPAGGPAPTPSERPDRTTGTEQ